MRARGVSNTDARSIWFMFWPNENGRCERRRHMCRRGCGCTCVCVCVCCRATRRDKEGAVGTTVLLRCAGAKDAEESLLRCKVLDRWRRTHRSSLMTTLFNYMTPPFTCIFTTYLPLTVRIKLFFLKWFTNVFIC